MQTVDFYCKKCKHSLKMTYRISGNPEEAVLSRIIMKCHCCKRTMEMKNYTEGMVVAQAGKNGKVFI